MMEGCTCSGVDWQGSGMTRGGIATRILEPRFNHHERAAKLRLSIHHLPSTFAPSLIFCNVYLTFSPYYFNCTLATCTADGAARPWPRWLPSSRLSYALQTSAALQLQPREPRALRAQEATMVSMNQTCATSMSPCRPSRTYSPTSSLKSSARCFQASAKKAGFKS